MSTEDNKTLALHAAEETMNQRNLAVLDDLCPPDFVWHNASTTIQGLDAFKQFLSMLLSAFPDSRFTIEDMIAEGDTVVTRHTFRGTHTGALMSIPPTGKQVTVTGISILHVTNGKGVEEWTNTDDLGLMQQLGVIPSMG